MHTEIAGHILCSNWIPSKLGETKIVEILNLKNPITCTFSEGLLKVHTNSRDENPNTLLISPLIKGWNLIMGCQLIYTKLSKELTEKLSKFEQSSFSFGVDIWCGYYSWMFSHKGELKRYYLFGDGEIEEEGSSIYDEFMKEYKHDECVFQISKKIGFDMNNISLEDLNRESKLYHFDHEIGWIV